MKKAIYTITLTFICTLSIYKVTAQQLDTAREKQAIIKLVKNYEDAWNRHDAKGLADNYDTDATWVNWFGAYYIGRKDIENHYDTVHTTYFKTSQYYTRLIEDISFIKPDIAISHVRTGLSGDSRFPGQTFEFRRTIVLVKHNNSWLIQAGQNAKLNPGVK